MLFKKFNPRSKLITALALGALMVPALTVMLVWAGAFGHLQTRAELLHYRNALASVVLSSEGGEIGRFYQENRTNVAYDQLPGHLINAVISAEDARFFSHHGVDVRSMFRVAFKTILLQNRRSGGGSTITQQLAKNMYGREHHTVMSLPLSKIREIILARRIEKVLSKEDILTLYLNTVSFGEDIYGIATAARRYFSKPTSELTVAEAAVLTGILKANTFYNPRLYPENALRRRNVIIRQMEKYGYLRADEADSICRLPLLTRYSNIESGGPADYFLVRVKEEAGALLDSVNRATGSAWDLESDGLTVVTTLNASLQGYANEAFAMHIPVMQERLERQYDSPAGRKLLSGLSDSLKKETVRLHAGLLAADPQTGGVLAYAGGIDFRRYPYDQVTARRQLASVFKPVIYAAAFENGTPPCRYLPNDSVSLEGYEEWQPKNFDGSYGGRYSAAGALVRSMNIPTLNLYMQTGFEAVDSLWKMMGFTFALEDAPSLALGTAEGAVAEVTRAYAAFANGGYRVDIYTVSSITAPNGQTLYTHAEPDAVRIMNERTSMLMGAILERAAVEGTGAALHSTYGLVAPFAGKTGTSQNYSDAWFACFNSKMVIVARVGASSPSVHFNTGSDGSGSALALPLVAITLKKAESDASLGALVTAGLPALPRELADELFCPDYREETLLDRFTDMFKNEKMRSTGKEKEPRQKRKGLFRRGSKK